jgi:hypothetical protein
MEELKAKTRGKPGEKITSRKRYISVEDAELRRLFEVGSAKWVPYLEKDDVEAFRQGMRYAMKARRHMFEGRFETSEKLFMNFAELCKQKEIPMSVVFRDFMLAFIKANGTKQQLSTSLTDINCALKGFHKLGRIREDLEKRIVMATAKANGEGVYMTQEDYSGLSHVIDATADVRNAQRQFIFGIEKAVLAKPKEFARKAIENTDVSTAWEDLKKEQGNDD